MDIQGLQFIRGDRILQILEEKSSIVNLRNNIIRAFPKTTKRQHATQSVQITELKYTPYIGTKSILIRALATNFGKEYNEYIMFTPISFEDEGTNNNITFIATNKKEYYIQPIRLSKINANVRCTCLDFRFRFALWNADDKSLFGSQPGPYKRKTKNRPPVNPKRVPGLCKHLLKTIETLRQANLVKF